MATLSPIPADAKFQDLTGRRFVRLSVLGYRGKRATEHRWLCRCECGSEKEVSATALRSGGTQSCGCLRAEKIGGLNRSHGFTTGKKKAPEYKIWGAMIRRCHKETDTCFDRYGRRGIRVCDRWRFGEGALSAFECFISDMGLRPSAKHSIERVDNDGDYEPANCIWADRFTQARNKSSNTLVILRGREMKLFDACALTGVPVNCARQRINTYGWSVEDAVTKPSKSPGNRRLRRKHQ